MKINEKLFNDNVIFVTNSDPLYIRSCASLGCNPIFISLKNNKRILSKGIWLDLNIPYNMITMMFINWQDCITLNNYNQFNFDCCNISEIEEFFCDNGKVSSLIQPIYFLNC